MPARYYVIKENLQEVDFDPFWEKDCIAVAVMSMEEFMEKTNANGIGIDIDLSFETGNIRTTKAIVNYDSFTGSISIPDRNDIFEHEYNFLFAVREHGIVFINDNDGGAQRIIDRIQRYKKWRAPSLERFIYDFLEGIISGDMALLDKYDREMDKMEDIIERDIDDEGLMQRLADIRSALQELRIHYQQLQDLAHEFEDNELDYFDDNKVSYFRLFNERVERLEGIVSMLRDHTMQVRDLYQSHLAENQNHIVTLLTVVTTIAVPLTFITGWYGMNFQYMPILSKPWGYPAVIIFAIALTVFLLWIFKKRKWL